MTVLRSCLGSRLPRGAGGVTPRVSCLSIGDRSPTNADVRTVPSSEVVSPMLLLGWHTHLMGAVGDVAVSVLQEAGVTLAAGLTDSEIDSVHVRFGLVSPVIIWIC